MSTDHISILIIASLLGFNAGLLAIRLWRWWLWRRRRDD